MNIDTMIATQYHVHEYKCCHEPCYECKYDYECCYGVCNDKGMLYRYNLLMV